MSPNERLRKQQQAQARADRKLRRDLARGFAPAWRVLQQRISQVETDLRRARAAGQPLRHLLDERSMLRTLERDTLATVTVFTGDAKRTIDRELLQQAKAGAIDAEQLLQASLPQGVLEPLPTVELQDLIGRTSQTGPLAAVLERLAGETAEAVRDALLEGVALGFGPRQIATDMRKASAAAYWKALRVARTETVGAYRRSALARYQGSGVVTGWTWVARLDSTTCPVCVAMHGTVHDVTEEFGSHPNCRCAPVPNTVPWTELGVRGARETGVTVERGETWLRSQPEDVQRRILGRGRFELWSAGEIDLADVVRVTAHPVWGEGRQVRSVRELRGGAAVLQVAPSEPQALELADAGDESPRAIPLSDALSINVTRNTDAEVRPAVDAVGRLIRTDSLGPGEIKVIEDPSLPVERRGEYRMNERAVVVNPRSVFGTDTVTHEIGHLIDHRLFGSDSWGFGSRDPVQGAVFDAWRAAVNDSAAVRALNSIDSPQADYMLMPHELFARSFSQWVGLRSSDERLGLIIQAEIDAQQLAPGVPPRYWDWNDFDAIAGALDQLFAQSGILIPS